MRRFFLIPAALVAMGVMFGCGTETAEKAEKAAETVTDHADHTDHTGHDHAADAVKDGNVEMASATLEGNLGCGHCTFQAKEGCSLAMKTSAGDIVFIEAGDRQEELMDARMDEPVVMVEGKISTVDGQTVIYADNIKMN